MSGMIDDERFVELGYQDITGTGLCGYGLFSAEFSAWARDALERYVFSAQNCLIQFFPADPGRWFICSYLIMRGRNGERLINGTEYPADGWSMNKVLNKMRGMGLLGLDVDKGDWWARRESRTWSRNPYRAGGSGWSAFDNDNQEVGVPTPLQFISEDGEKDILPQTQQLARTAATEFGVAEEAYRRQLEMQRRMESESLAAIGVDVAAIEAYQRQLQMQREMAYRQTPMPRYGTLAPAAVTGPYPWEFNQPPKLQPKKPEPKMATLEIPSRKIRLGDDD